MQIFPEIKVVNVHEKMQIIPEIKVVNSQEKNADTKVAFKEFLTPRSAVSHLSLMDICLADMPSDSWSPDSVGDSRSPEWTLCLLRSSQWSRGRDWDLTSGWGKDWGLGGVCGGTWGLG